MADVITRFKLETTQFDSKLRDTAKALKDVTHQASLGGKDFDNFSKKAIEGARALGTVQSGATNTKDKLRDLVGSYNDAARAYNQLTDKAKQGEFGRAMSTSLQQLQERIRETKQELYSLGDSAKGTGGGGLFGGGKLDGMLQVFGGNVMTKIASMGAGLVTELGDAVKQGIELAKQGEGIRIAFERLGRGDILQGLRDATHGTVTDLELMKAAVKFNDFKLPLDELGTMLAFAQQKAKDTGQSVDYMVDSIVTGLGRKSLMILDNLGLSATQIKERMAETGDMTKAVGAIIREQMQKAGDYVETAADRAAQANVNLQNKMEELGRKFAPLEEASNNFWTSMKIGILDVVGGPLARLLNGLTEAGRRMNALNDVNGNDGNGPSLAQRRLAQLRNYSGSQKGVTKQTVYDRQIARYTKEEEQAWRKANEYAEKYQKTLKELKSVNPRTDEKGVQASALKQQADRYKKQQEAYTFKAQAIQTSKAEYQKGAQTILNPTITPEVDTTKAEQNIDRLKVKLIELQAQRKKAIADGDTDLSKNLQKQITQINAAIKKGSGGTTTTPTTHQTTQQRAQESFTKAEQNYKQALEQAAMELKAGTINQAQAKQKELQAAEARWKAIGDARNIADSTKLKQAQVEAAANYQQLAAEVKTATERQKAIDKATRDLENANQKLADARREMAQAEQSGDRKAYYAAEKKAATAQQEVTRLETVKVNVEQGRVDLPDIPDSKTIKVNIEATTSNLDAEIAHLKDEMSQLAVGSEAFDIGQAKMVDFTTLRSLINQQVESGLSIDPEASAKLMNQIINGENISDDTWQGIINKINEKLAELKIDPIKIDFKTGNVAKEGKETENSWKNAASAVAAVGSAMQSLEDPGAKIAGTIGQAIASIALGFAQATAASSGGGIFAWIAAITGGLATMISTISAIHSTTGYANGGIVGRAGGGFVPGNNMSGDNVPGMVDGVTPVGLNSGELILNKAQQSNLASQMRDGGLQNLHLEATVHAEQIRLALNNNGKRTGRGELVTWKP